MQDGTETKQAEVRWNAARIPAAVMIVLSLVHIVLLRFASVIPSHSFLFFFFFVSLVLAPGYVWSVFLYRRAAWSFRLLLSLVIGTSLLYVLLFIFTAARWKITALGIVVPIMTLAGAAVLLVRPPRSGAGTVTVPTGSSGVPRPLTLLFAALIVFTAFLILGVGDPLLYTGDSQDHIAYIRTISRTGEAFPSEFLYREGGVLTRDIRKGMAHAMWGTINALTGYNDVREVWGCISCFGTVFILISLLCAGAALFHSAGLGLLAAVLFVLFYHGGLRGYQLITIAYGFPFGKIFYVSFLIFILSYCRRGDGRSLTIAALSSLAATATHIGHFFVTVLAIVIIALVLLVRAEGRERVLLLKRRVPILSTVPLMVNLPYLLLRYVRDYAPANVIHTHMQGIFTIAERFVILNPFFFFRSAGPLFVLALLCVFVLWRRSRREEALRILLAGTIAVVAIVFNPVLTPLLIERISYLLYRFEFAFLPMLVTAFLLRELWLHVRRRVQERSRRALTASLAAVIGLLAYPLVKTVPEFAYAGSRHEYSMQRSCRTIDDLFAAINRTVPVGGVIASDPITSYSIPAFTDGYVVCTYDQHSIPNDSTALERILACRDLYRPTASMRELGGILEQYGAGYVAINGRIPRYLRSNYWIPDSADAAGAARRFAAAPELFECVYEHESVSLFRFTPGTYTGHATPEAGHLGRAVTAAELPGFVETAVAGVYLERASLSRSRVTRGDTLMLHLTYVAEEASPPGSYVTFVRFDTDFEKGALYHPAYGKVYRKLLERIAGNRFRFRVDHLPLRGVLPPDRWPPLREILDHLLIRVPADVSPGDYVVSVKLTPRPHSANYTMRDLFTDDDFYSGTPVASVRIE